MYKPKIEIMNEEKKDLLTMAVINQFEVDLEDQEYECLDEMLTQLLKSEENQRVLIDYLSDDSKEKWIEGKVTIKY